MADKRRRYPRKIALRLDQNAARPLYQFSLTAQELMSVADISRIGRSEGGGLLGHQRGEVRRHIQEIVAYLNTDDVLLPNSLVVAFSQAATFRPIDGADPIDDATAGVLSLPLPKEGEVKIGWIVDGQQRATALMESTRSSWPVPVNAFIAEDVGVQRDQSLRVNNTKPLPRGLITELQPEVTGPLPRNLSSKRIPAALADLLNRDPASPFHGLIRRASTPPARRRAAVVADASVVNMLEESLISPAGCLFPYHNISSGETETDGVWRVLLSYWSAVRATFPDAWGRPPAQSRLMHGTGIRAMGRLMDRVVSGLSPGDPEFRDRLRAEVATVAPVCRWTSGRWEEIGLEWREVQNVPRHLRMLSSFLVRAYHQAREATT